MTSVPAIPSVHDGRCRGFLPQALAAALLAASLPCAAMSLTEAGTLAMERDPTVAVFRAQYEADRQNGQRELAELLPTVDLKGTGYYADTNLTGDFGQVLGAKATVKDHYPGWSATLEVRQPLFRLDWSDRRSRAKALDAQADVTRADAIANVIQRVASRYLDVVLAQDQLRQTESEAKALRSSLENTRQRFDVDLVPGTDVKEAQARDDLAQAQLIAARRSLADALDAMSETTGVPHLQSLPGLRDDAVIGPPVPADPEAWVQMAMDRSPTLSEARLAVEIAQTDIATTRAATWPQLDLVASAGRQDSLDYIVGQRTDDARVGVELTVPIYGGITVPALRQSEAQLAVKQASYEQQKTETARQVRQLFRSVQTRLTEVAAYRRSLDSAVAADAATHHGYDAGTRTIIEVLDGQSRVAQASRDWNVARYNLLADLLGLKRASGTLSVQDFSDIDHLLGADVPVDADGGVSAPAN